MALRCVSLATMLALTSAAAAQPEPVASPVDRFVRVHLRYEAPTGCLSAPALARAVERALGRDVFASARESDLALDVALTRDAAGWRVDLALRGEGGAAVGERTLTVERPDCRAVDEPLVLVAGLLLDVPRPAEALRVPPDPPRPPAPEPAPGALELELAPALLVGPLPHPTPALQLAVGVGLPSVPIVLRATSTLAVDTSVRPAPDREVVLSARTLASSACLEPLELAPARLGVCAGASLIWTAARGIGFDVERQSDSVVAAAILALRARVTLLGPLTLSGGVRGGWVPTPPRTAVLREEETEVVHAAEPFVVTGWVALGLRGLM